MRPVSKRTFIFFSLSTKLYSVKDALNLGTVTRFFCVEVLHSYTVEKLRSLENPTFH